LLRAAISRTLNVSSIRAEEISSTGVIVKSDLFWPPDLLEIQGTFFGTSYLAGHTLYLPVPGIV